MKIWLINQHCSPPSLGHFNRHYYFAKFLTQMGHEVEVFAGSNPHNSALQLVPEGEGFRRAEYEGVHFHFVRTRVYNGSFRKRVCAMLEFCRRLKKQVKGLGRPDVILASSPHMLVLPLALKLARRYGCPAVLEIRDLWPESFVAYGLVSEHNPLLPLIYRYERTLYRKADALIFTMKGGAEYIKDKGWDSQSGGPIDLAKVTHINNGVDLAEFRRNAAAYHEPDADLDDAARFKVVYAGSLRLVNNVLTIVKAAEILHREGHADIRFLFYGEGDQREELEARVRAQGLDNVRFKGFVDKNRIPSVLMRADLNILHYEKTKLAKYGTSMNKMFDYFASGKPTLSDCKVEYDLINQYNCGVSRDISDSETLAAEILRFRHLPADEYRNYCRRALAAAEDYDFKKLSGQLLEVLREANARSKG